MKEDLRKILTAERKRKRDVAELEAMREKVSQQVQPDQKVLKMIDEELAALKKL